ncbi:MAG TPA: SurA N-terminal domain-containing protein [Chloroflexota bacterium]
MGPGDRRDGQPLIFGWGSHLTRAQKQQYRGRFVLAGGIFIFALIALVIGAGAVQQLVLKPRTAVASVNGNGIQRQWYDKNLAYTQFVLQHQTQDIQSQYQAIVANQQGNARATATANPQPPGSPTAFTSGTPEAGGTPAPSGTAGPTLTPSPTFNPEESATVAALSSQFTTDQAQLNAAQQLTIENLIDDDLMRQNAGKLGISVSSDEVSAQAKKTADQIGGDPALKQLLSTAHLSQDDFNHIQYDIVQRDKFQAYFADHPGAAPAPSPTPVPSPTATVEAVAGPQPPTPTAVPTPVPTPGADSLDRWLEEQRTSAKITRSSFPLPPA